MIPPAGGVRCPTKEILDKELRARGCHSSVGGTPSFFDMYKYTQATLNRKLKRDSPLGKASGANCVFLQLTKTVGFKLFRSKTDAMKARRMQLKAYKAKIAPEVGSLLNLQVKNVKSKSIRRFILNRLPNNLRVWGYMTEVVNVGGFAPNDASVTKLVQKLKRIGITTHDCHAGNFGWRTKEKGKPIWIDFDPDYNLTHLNTW